MSKADCMMLLLEYCCKMVTCVLSRRACGTALQYNCARAPKPGLAKSTGVRSREYNGSGWYNGQNGADNLAFYCLGKRIVLSFTMRRLIRLCVALPVTLVQCLSDALLLVWYVTRFFLSISNVRAGQTGDPPLSNNSGHPAERVEV